MSTGSVVIRTRMTDTTTTIDLRFSHPMEPGTRTDAQGIAIPAWYLTSMDVYHNDSLISNLELGPLVSRNPAISLAIEGAKIDDLIKISWMDNRGKTGERSAKVIA